MDAGADQAFRSAASDYILTGPILPETERVVLMLIAGAPSMTTSCMIAGQYGLDEDYASTAVFVTTICCMVTIPLLFLTSALFR